MDKIIIQEGGMPLRLTDFGFIHDAYNAGFKSVLNSIKNIEPCILSGLKVTDGGTHWTVSDGSYFNGEEIFVVAGNTFAKQVDYDLYIQLLVVNQELRTFFDTTSKNCHQLRRYQLIYTNEDPGNSFLLQNLIRFSEIVDNNTTLKVVETSALLAGSSVLYATGFTPATTYQAVQLSKNQFGEVMIIAAFNATTNPSGKLFTLPSDYRPVADIVGTFMAENAIGLLKIKAGSGEVHVVGASTTSSNYITFRYHILHIDLVGFNLSTEIPDPE
ncbi:MAG: hypothetical protein ACNA7V_06650 [Bacteroidales bacterium]